MSSPVEFCAPSSSRSTSVASNSLFGRLMSSPRASAPECRGSDHLHLCEDAEAPIIAKAEAQEIGAANPAAGRDVRSHGVRSRWPRRWVALRCSASLPSSSSQRSSASGILFGKPLKSRHDRHESPPLDRDVLEDTPDETERTTTHLASRRTTVLPRTNDGGCMPAECAPVHASCQRPRCGSP